MRPGIIVLAILCACSSVDANELTLEERTARALSYKNISIGTTLKDLKRKFPKAILTASDKSTGTSVYVLLGDGAPGAEVIIFRGAIYQMSLLFTPDAFSKTGGRSVLLRNLTKKLGQPHLTRGGFHQWTFPNVQRVIRYGFNNDNAVVIVFDTAVSEQIEVVKSG